MPLQETSGAASYDAYGGGVAAVPNYIEDVFSTYLYTGNGSTQTITNGIDLAGKGGLTWIKSRSNVTENLLYDTARGAYNYLISSTTGAQSNGSPTGLSAFNADGFSVAGTTIGGGVNGSGATYASWTFRKQPKFFDVVTYTGNGLDRTIAHNLGSVPGCIIVKCTSSGGSATYNWVMWHRSLASNEFLQLNTTDQKFSGASVFNTTSVPNTSTTFSVGTNAITNQSGQTYVAYLFAHNAGGFGLTGTDNVISCGSFTTDGSGNATVNLGYEPQFLIDKNSSTTGNWFVTDIMRGMSVTSFGYVSANTTAAESAGAAQVYVPTSTGFQVVGFTAGVTHIYIAIRRGPMKTPTSGTSVFTTDTTSGSTFPAFSSNFPVDLGIVTATTGAGKQFQSRLMGTYYVDSTSTAAEVSSSLVGQFDSNVGFCGGIGAGYMSWMFRRAPGFFDEVCWTGDSTNPRSISHNLTVAPTLIITKKRNSTSNWITGFDFASTTYKYFFLNDTGAANPDTYASTPVYGGNPTASVFVVGNQGNMNISGDTYVSYLFASCPGVSKVFTFTGNGTTQTINCGFTGGARFVLLKASSATGGWYVYDTARGMTTLTDPYLFLNSTAAESATLGSVTTVTTGFAVNEAITTGVNTNGVTYVGIAIA